MQPLTDIQQQVFDFIRERIDAGESPPTAREIAAHFGWRSKRAADCHLQALIKKGWLTSEPGKARSLRLVNRSGSPRQPVVDIPIFGSIPAGFGDEADEDADGCVSVDVSTLGFTPTRNTFALRVTGDSMIGRHICDGDIAVFEHGPEPRQGQIVAALIDRKSTLKTFIIKNRKPYLRAENPKYPELVPSEELVIQGVFRVLIRRAQN